MMNKRLMRFASGSMASVWKNVLVQWLGLCGNIATVLSICWVFGALFSGTVTARGIVVATAIIAAGLVLRFVCAMVSSRLSFNAAEKVKLLLRQKIYSKLLRLGPSYHQRVGTSEVVQMAVEGVDQLEVYFGKYMPQLFYSLLAPLTLFMVLCFINVPSAVVLLVCVPLIPISIIAVQKFAKKLLAKYWSKYTTLGDSFLENLQGLTTLKIYGSDEAKNEEMNERAEGFRKVTMKVLIMQLNSVTLMDLIAYGGAALGVIVSVSQFAAGNIDFAGCLCIILLAADFFIPLRLLGSFFHIAMNGMAASEKIFKLLDMPEPEAGTRQELDMSKGLKLQNVVFSYDGQREVLENITMEAGAGLTAIVGQSGCGKSTIAALITGQNKGYEGNVALGGAELAQIDPAVLAKTVTLVPHNSYLFKGTVSENLLMAAPDATEEDLWQALRQVRLDAFLQGEDGLDTKLAEKASNLSGGQCQRLGLARAILHNTPAYIFDEATSNIDVESENDIAEVIGQLAETKTVVLISHRLANVVAAKHIYMMENGHITEEGTHGQLIARNGAYANMFAAQSQLEKRSFGEVRHA